MKANVLKRVLLARATVFVGLAMILAVVLGAASTALAANEGNFILGETNVATLITRLAGANGVDGAMFEVQNNNAGTNDTALSLKVQAGESPMTVNSPTKVAKLNADSLDGKDELDFMPSKTYRVITPLGPGTPTSNPAYFQQHAVCDSGDRVLSGGFNEVDSQLVESVALGEKWYTRVHSNGNDKYQTFAQCADFPPFH